jgi:hypothetical protein
MVETAAHVTDHVFPRLPVRQGVLCVPKRLCYLMQRDGSVPNMVLRIFLRVIAQSLQSNSPGAAQVDKAALHIGAVAFIHVCVVDGVLRLWRDCWTSWKRVFVAVSKRCELDLQKNRVNDRNQPLTAFQFPM